MADSSPSDKPDLLADLERALESFEAPEHLKSALRRVFTEDALDAAVATPEQLAEVDTVAQSRLAYVLSLLKLVNFLRLPLSSTGARESQAKLAFQYVRHAEAQGLAALQMGRAKTDAMLQEEIERLRQRLTATSEHKAKILADPQTH